MIFCSLGSGSKGNSIYIGSRQSAVLIDQGFSLKKMLERMETAGLNPETIKAVIITHEHSDHCKGIGVLGRKFKVPIYITKDTHSALKPDLLKNVNVRLFNAGDTIEIDHIAVKTFHIPHDAVDPIGIIADDSEKRIAVVTDMGEFRNSVAHHLSDLDLLMLESNHDVEMLTNGPYPLMLKHRIRSRVGHLSNDQAVDFLNKLNLNSRLKHLILAHLSEENNDSEIIHRLFKKNAENNSANYSIHVAAQHSPTKVFNI